jgi:toxin ParE1/3/4
MRISIGRVAKRDVTRIVAWVAERNPRAARAMLQRIDARIAELVVFPDLGRRRDDLAPGLRMVPVEPYLIFYRVVSEEVQIVRVLHGARDLPRIRMPAS